MPKHASQVWMVSPAFDLAFLINAYWLAILLPGMAPAEGHGPLDFWQVYFLTTPHRWITLGLVALDPDRREGRGAWFAGLAVVAAGAVAVSVWFGALFCLLIVDFAWNAWHFGSQHAGVLRIYTRKAGGQRPRLESWLLRTAVCYVLLRLPRWTTAWSTEYAQAGLALEALDLLAGVALGLVWSGMFLARRRSLPERLYVTSVCGLYAALLVAIRLGEARWIVPLAMASTLFHAVEYLAIVTHYARQRRTGGSPRLFQSMARQWVSVLAIYLLCWGLVGFSADTFTKSAWGAINLWAAFLHYAYDGMIWKLRRPATAALLGIEGSPNTASGEAA